MELRISWKLDALWGVHKSGRVRAEFKKICPGQGAPVNNSAGTPDAADDLVYR
jgi:hypothetical protein